MMTNLFRAISRACLYLLLSTIFFRLDATNNQETFFIACGFLFIVFSGLADIFKKDGDA